MDAAVPSSVSNASKDVHVCIQRGFADDASQGKRQREEQEREAHGQARPVDAGRLRDDATYPLYLI